MQSAKKIIVINQLKKTKASEFWCYKRVKGIRKIFITDTGLDIQTRLLHEKWRNIPKFLASTVLISKDFTKEKLIKLLLVSPQFGPVGQSSVTEVNLVGK